MRTLSVHSQRAGSQAFLRYTHRFWRNPINSSHSPRTEPCLTFGISV